MHRGRSKAVSADSAQGTSPMVHIWCTEEPNPDELGQDQTNRPFPRRPTVIGLFWSRLVRFCLVWKP